MEERDSDPGDAVTSGKTHGGLQKMGVRQDAADHEMKRAMLARKVTEQEAAVSPGQDVGKADSGAPGAGSQACGGFQDTALPGPGDKGAGRKAPYGDPRRCRIDLAMIAAQFAGADHHLAPVPPPQLGQVRKQSLAAAVAGRIKWRAEQQAFHNGHSNGFPRHGLRAGEASLVWTGFRCVG